VALGADGGARAPQHGEGAGRVALRDDVIPDPDVHRVGKEPRISTIAHTCELFLRIELFSLIDWNVSKINLQLNTTYTSS
jgi:hypothetical protein